MFFIIIIMNKSFIFDWSGTLSDNFHCFCQVCNLMFKELDIKPISEDEIRLNFTLPYMKFWNKYFPDLTIEKQNKLYEQFIHQTDEPELYKHVDEILNFIHNSGWKIFILSSDPISKLIPETKKSGLSQLFEKVVGSIHEKDKAIKSLVYDFNLDNNLTFYVGDTSGDVEAGKSANVKTIGISWGFQSKELLSKSEPDFLIDNILEIKYIIKGIKD
jgi:phosphoglycolate phosphatase